MPSDTHRRKFSLGLALPHRDYDPRPRHLLNLPTELLLLILNFASTSPPPGQHSPSGLHTLLTLSRVCKPIHHLVFAPEFDDAVWRAVAIARLGTPYNLSLDNVKYPGISARDVRSGRKKRSWKEVVKLGVAWERPFPPAQEVEVRGGWKVQKALRSFRPLPAPREDGKEAGWGVELVCPGDGDSRTQRFETVMAGDEGSGGAGRITFRVRRQEIRQPPDLAGVHPIQQQQQQLVANGEPRTRTVTAVVDLLGKGGARVGSRIRKGKGRSKVVAEEVRPGQIGLMARYPGFSGLVPVEKVVKDAEGKEKSTWVVKKVDPIKGELVEDRIWDLGGRKPDMLIGDGEVLIALCFDDPDAEVKSEGPSHIPANLVCVERVRDKGTGWLGTGETWRSKVRWEVNTAEQWRDEERYTEFAHLRNFHMTRTHLVALVTRHPIAQLHKLTGTFFYVIDLSSGQILRRIKLKKRLPTPETSPHTTAPTALPNTTPAANDPNTLFAAPPPAPVSPAAFTTALSHDFLLTDNHIVCGGPGGGLWVYNYTLPQLPVAQPSSSLSSKTVSIPAVDKRAPLYTFPDPWDPQSPLYRANPDIAAIAPTETTTAPFVGRQWSALTLSTCGRYLGATTSDQLWVWDMHRKRLRGVWSNGRKVERRLWYSLDPADGWVGGVWILLEYARDEPKTPNSKVAPNNRKGRVDDRARGGHRGSLRRRPSARDKMMLREGSSGDSNDESDADEEDDEIMVGFLTDLGVPEPDAAGQNVLPTLALGDELRRLREWWESGRMGGWLVMAIVVAVFAWYWVKGGWEWGEGYWIL